MVLIMDVARYKYPPHWVELPILYKAINSIDSSTGEYRGYLKCTKFIETNKSLLNLNNLSNKIYELMDKWQHIK